MFYEDDTRLTDFALMEHAKFHYQIVRKEKKDDEDKDLQITIRLIFPWVHCLLVFLGFSFHYRGGGLRFTVHILDI